MIHKSDPPLPVFSKSRKISSFPPETQDRVNGCGYNNHSTDQPVHIFKRFIDHPRNPTDLVDHVFRKNKKNLDVDMKLQTADLADVSR